MVFEHVEGCPEGCNDTDGDVENEGTVLGEYIGLRVGESVVGT